MRFYVEIAVPDEDTKDKDLVFVQSDVASALEGCHPYLRDVTVWTLPNLLADVADGLVRPGPDVPPAMNPEPCPEDLIPGDPSIPCALPKGHEGSHQDRRLLPKRRWT